MAPIVYLLVFFSLVRCDMNYQSFVFYCRFMFLYRVMQAKKMSVHWVFLVSFRQFQFASTLSNSINRSHAVGLILAYSNFFDRTKRKWAKNFNLFKILDFNNTMNLQIDLPLKKTDCSFPQNLCSLTEFQSFGEFREILKCPQVLASSQRFCKLLVLKNSRLKNRFIFIPNQYIL